MSTVVIDERIEALMTERGPSEILASIARVCLLRARRDLREGLTSERAWSDAADSIDATGADLGAFDYLGIKIADEPLCYGCRTLSEVCTC